MASLVCTQTLRMYHGRVAAVEGKVYPIISETDEEIEIINEYKGCHTFSKEPGPDYYGNWFVRLP